MFSSEVTSVALRCRAIAMIIRSAGSLWSGSGSSVLSMAYAGRRGRTERSG